MPKTKNWKRLARDLFLYQDSCNVYLLRYGDRAIAVDFGTGRWLDHLGEIGVAEVEHVVLTHAHRDQCCGLYRRAQWPFAIHAPSGEADLLAADSLKTFWHTYQTRGCPASYAAPRLPVPGVRLHLGADSERLIGPARFCGIATPGHTRGALSYMVEWRDKHLCFCGDAVHAGGTLHQPYHLEWDHWTPQGALAAWHGLERLGYCHFDLLLPAHGPIADQRPRSCLAQTQRRLMDFIRAKGSVCAGEKNRWLDVESLACGAARVLPHLYHFGGNSYLLISDADEGLVVDPTQGSIALLEGLMDEIGLRHISAATATHFHLDHSDALNFVRQRHGAAVWLHPWVAEPIGDRDRCDVPWLPAESIPADRLLPAEGIFRWNEYRFTIRPFPGQTWWHCAFDTLVDDRRVLFSGDNFQPPTRWNGTGGFCAFNGSRFADGFSRSAQIALDIAPEIICNGHGNIYRFATSHYRRILRWSARAEKAVEALCPSADWLADYDCRTLHWSPFVSRAKPGQEIELTLSYHNYHKKTIHLRATPIATSTWNPQPTQRNAQVLAGQTRTIKFTTKIPKKTPAGRHLFTADVELDGHLMAEPCIAIIDIA